VFDVAMGQIVPGLATQRNQIAREFAAVWPPCDTDPCRWMALACGWRCGTVVPVAAPGGGNYDDRRSSIQTSRFLGCQAENVPRKVSLGLIVFGVMFATALATAHDGRGKGDDDNDRDEARIRIGFDIAPVALHFKKKDRDLVGLGSYIVNAQGGCNDATRIRLVSSGLPANLTFEQFKLVIRTGVDLDKTPPNVPSASHDLLQVMPWPVFQNMTDHDLLAIYKYLSAIPHAEPGP
jgi:hypothetical protein